MARKFLVALDLSKNELQNAVVQVLASAPSSPAEGQIYYNSTDQKAYIRNASTWQALDQATIISFGTAGTSAVGDSASAGVASTASRSDHVHGRESFGTTASTQAVGDSQTAGAATTPSRSDHKHGLPAFGAATGQTSFGSAASNGAATTIARSDHAHGTPAHDATAHSTIKLSDLTAPTTAVSFGSQKITNLATPTADSDAATKAYVDATATGLDIKASVRAATTGPITLSAPGTSIDGVTMVSGDRVLVKDQGTGSQNGIYVWNGSAAAMTRSTDADSSSEVTAGMFTFVEEGTVNADSGWVLTTNNPITLGTTSLAFTQFNSANAYIAGNGLTLTGSTFNVGAGTGITVSSTAVSIDTTVVARKYSVSVGNGAALSFTVSHGLGTSDVTVQVFDNTTGAQVEADITHALTSPFAVTVTFTSAPAANAYRVVVIG